jgi:peroxiredoxin
MTLEIDKPAPDFTLKDQHGQDVSPSDFRGRKNMVIVFYPFAFSRVCTGELCELRDNIADFSDAQTALVAVSCDHMFSLRAFAEHDAISFPLLSDYWPHGAVSTAYGIFNDKVGCSGRATFIVDRDGVLRWQVENEIPNPRDIDDYRKILADLG